MTQERLGDAVRLPSRDALIDAEHEPVRVSRIRRIGGGVVGKYRPGGRIEINDVAAFGRGRGEHRAVGSFDPSGTERQPAGVEMDVVPSQADVPAGSG